ncbi:hypothetical protein V1520DRAFT_345689 [Lipomyces starkeyi]
MDQFSVEKSIASVLAIGQQFANDCKAKSYVQQYAISNHFANNTFLLVCKCSGKVCNTCNFPAVVGTRGEMIRRASKRREVFSLSVLGEMISG